MTGTSRLVGLFVRVAAVFPLTGCPGEPGETEGESTAISSSTSDTGDDTNATTTPTTGVEQCQYPPEPPTGAFVVRREPLEGMSVVGACPGLATPGVFPGGTNIPIQIWRPATNQGDFAWPNGQFPVVIFAPGNRQALAGEMSGAALYSHIIDPLVAEGFIVAGLDLDADQDFEVSFRWRAMICAMKWLENTWTESPNSRTNCDLVAMGHSRGGEAAFQVIENFSTELNDPPRRLAAAVGIAPRSTTDAEGSLPISAEKAVPYLIVVGGSDEDVGGGDAARAYDIMASEEEVLLAQTDKVLVWGYDVPHNAWGGVDVFVPPAPVPTGIQLAKGRAISGEYIPAFLKWQVLRREPVPNREMFATLVRPSAPVSAFPVSVQDSDFWSGIQPPFMELSGRPLIFADVSLGSSDNSVAPLRVDTMERAMPVECGDLSPSSSGGTVVVEGILPTQVCLGPAADLASQTNQEHHETSVLRIAWGDQLDPGSVRWSIGSSLENFSFLSMRLGQNYSSTTQTAVDVSVVLHGQGGQAQPIDVEVSLGLQVRQDDSVIGPLPIVTDFMRTVRIPLQDFCTADLDLSTVSGLSVVVQESLSERALLVDSIEFTRAFEDGPVGCN